MLAEAGEDKICLNEKKNCLNVVNIQDADRCCFLVTGVNEGPQEGS